MVEFWSGIASAGASAHSFKLIVLRSIGNWGSRFLVCSRSRPCGI
jgi:hypothetical protein